MNIVFDDLISCVAKNLTVVTLEADVVNVETSDELWAELETAGNHVAAKYNLPEINRRRAIAATRAVYKALGKDPNRYRPSSEALCRRLVKGMSLYRINALVDLVNIVSFQSGYSIGGFDADCIAGDTLTLGVGREGEMFEGIGRGQLNIACMPVYRDSVGGIGTPTSDEERTKMTLSTKHLLMCINVYAEEMPIDETIGLAVDLLTRHCSATNINVKRYNPRLP